MCHKGAMDVVSQVKAIMYRTGSKLSTFGPYALQAELKLHKCIQIPGSNPSLDNTSSVPSFSARLVGAA